MFTVAVSLVSLWFANRLKTLAFVHIVCRNWCHSREKDIPSGHQKGKYGAQICVRSIRNKMFEFFFPYEMIGSHANILRFSTVIYKVT